MLHGDLSSWGRDYESSIKICSWSTFHRNQISVTFQLSPLAFSQKTHQECGKQRIGAICQRKVFIMLQYFYTLLEKIVIKTPSMLLVLPVESINLLIELLLVLGQDTINFISDVSTSYFALLSSQ